MEENEPKREETKKETDKKCPSCGGVMDFNPGNGTLACPYCGHEEQIPVTKEEQTRVNEKDFDKAETLENSDWGAEKKSIICKSCGAESVYDSNQLANECPYCGSNQVMEEKSKGTGLAPDGVCPFVIDFKQAGENFSKWLKGDFFCPEQAKKKAKPSSFKGVYIPFWTFDVDTYSQYRGEYGIDREVKDGDTTKTVTDWHKVSGHYGKFFDDLPVCASNRYNKNMLKELEPFDTEHCKHYKPEYVAGYVAEKYTVGLKDGWNVHGKKRIHDVLEEKICERIRQVNHADHARVSHFDTEYFNLKYKYLLLPIWLSSFKFQDKIYNFMVNGQTGKVAGEKPVDWLKVTLVLLGLIILYLIIFSITGGGD